MRRSLWKPTDSDILAGVRAIAEHIGLPERTVFHLIERGALPVFKLPHCAKHFARKSRLDAYLAEIEATAEPKAASAPAAPSRPVRGRRRRAAA